MTEGSTTYLRHKDRSWPALDVKLPADADKVAKVFLALGKLGYDLTATDGDHPEAT